MLLGKEKMYERPQKQASPIFLSHTECSPNKRAVRAPQNKSKNFCSQEEEEIYVRSETCLQEGLRGVHMQRQRQPRGVRSEE